MDGYNEALTIFNRLTIGKLTDLEYGVKIYMDVVLMTGFVMNSVVIYLMVTDKSKRIKNVNGIILLLNVACDWLLCTLVFNGVANLPHKIFTTDFHVCMAEAIIILFSQTISLFLICALAMEQYLHVIHSYTVTWTQLYIFLFAAVSTGVIFTSAPFWNPDWIMYPTLTEIRCVCMFKFSDKRVLSKVWSSLTGLTLLSVPIISGTAYYQIYTKIHSQRKNIREAPLTISSDVDERLRNVQVAVLRRSVVLSTFCALGWGLFFVKIMYSVVTSEDVPVNVEFANYMLLILIGSIINPSVILITDPRLRDILNARKSAANTPSSSGLGVHSGASAAGRSGASMGIRSGDIP